jgi:hypothetical protein
MSEIHLLFSKASWTVLRLAILLGMVWNNLGAISLMFCPESHLSVQNKVLAPFPTSEIRTRDQNSGEKSPSFIGNLDR